MLGRGQAEVEGAAHGAQKPKQASGKAGGEGDDTGHRTNAVME